MAMQLVQCGVKGIVRNGGIWGGVGGGGGNWGGYEVLCSMTSGVMHVPYNASKQIDANL